ncbi:hypothetical protein PFICI_11439 [Pestalotiopsis fici W106-1]|uniref:EamA domain-containing protein n=1 Tax=Pestalotiopsis fici (strain W106-1 / CGMCC3.15140) TaxID=1229662 RepID=W3WUP6_PESFW|nr:uncharacterized protein PFICI_11439 [Pestalotiopsis fici W106-1]ETS77565.1 hypothetical protein PFICI_11439 [Pestalotiopsis fici W106-1]
MPSPLSASETSSAKHRAQENGDTVMDLHVNKITKGDTTERGAAAVSDCRQDSLNSFSYDGQPTPTGSPREPSPSHHSRPGPVRKNLKEKIHSFFSSQWQQNGGPFLIILSQFFAANMNLSTRLLEIEDDLHPMQILCARMTATVLITFAYMWYRPVRSAPWGPRETRPLLVLRAFSGFVGLYGMWYSIIYLPLAEATVISFLSPNLAGYLCRIFLKEPFTRREQLGSYLALGGVVLVTRPMSLLSSPPEAPATDATSSFVNNNNNDNNNSTMTMYVIRKGLDYVPTVAERLSSVGMGLLGVVGGAVAIASLRCIGPRAHPLISVNYFSLFCSVVSILTLAVAPLLGYGQDAQGQGGLRFALPSGARQCGLLLAVGLAGFGTQFFLATGLSKEKSNRATAMIYTHVLFAAFFDRFIFGQVMGWVSVAGCALVVGSALWVALGNGATDGAKTGRDETRRSDIESSLPSSTRFVVGASALSGGEDVPILANVDGEDVEYLDENGDIDLGLLRPHGSD